MRKFSLCCCLFASRSSCSRFKASAASFSSLFLTSAISLSTRFQKSSISLANFLVRITALLINLSDLLAFIFTSL
uniref:Uncharacterized protein n=1 Tax=Rhizophora mucronata TaxID=61149 RepID=A0A2P2MVM1_RHIMU